jgi:hypothetical protein
MKDKTFFIISLAMIFFLLAFGGNIFAEEEKISLESIKKAVKEAIKEGQAEEQQKQEQLSLELKTKLDATMDDWLADQGRILAAQLNQLKHDSWATLNTRVTPVPYDYYLRDWSYFLVKKDISKTDSFVTPYKGVVEVIEERYVERYHSSDTANIKDYLHTIRRPLTINLEYRQDNLIITNVKEGELSIVAGWQNKKGD